MIFLLLLVSAGGIFLNHLLAYGPYEVPKLSTAKTIFVSHHEEFNSTVWKVTDESQNSEVSTEKSEVVTPAENPATAIEVGTEKTEVVIAVGNPAAAKETTTNMSPKDLGTSPAKLIKHANIFNDSDDVDHFTSVEPDIATVKKQRCSPIKCLGKLCYEDMLCHQLPPFLREYKNPCFYEKVSELVHKGITLYLQNSAVKRHSDFELRYEISALPFGRSTVEGEAPYLTSL